MSDEKEILKCNHDLPFNLCPECSQRQQISLPGEVVQAMIWDLLIQTRTTPKEAMQILIFTIARMYLNSNKTPDEIEEVIQKNFASLLIETYRGLRLAMLNTSELRPN